MKHRRIGLLLAAFMALSGTAGAEDYPFTGFYAFEPASTFSNQTNFGTRMLDDVRSLLDKVGETRPVDWKPSESDLCFEGFMVQASDGSLVAYFLDTKALAAALDDPASSVDPRIAYRKGSSGTCSFDPATGVETCTSVFLNEASEVRLFHQHPGDLAYAVVEGDGEAAALKSDPALFERKKDRTIDCSAYRQPLIARIEEGEAIEADTENTSNKFGVMARLFIEYPWMPAALAKALVAPK